MGLGSSVDKLIELYSNCISLLTASQQRGEETKYDHDRTQQAQLRKSLESDRARVRSAYSSAVSEAGSRFERGDDRARSALSRVLGKLKAAIANILRSAGLHHHHHPPALDYESLMLLSNASRSETIRAFDQLSRRLGSSASSLTVASSSSRPTRRKSRQPSASSSGSAKSVTGRRSSMDGTRRDTSSPSGKKTAASPSIAVHGKIASGRDATSRRPKAASPPRAPTKSKSAKHRSNPPDTIPPPAHNPGPPRRESAATVPQPHVNRMSLASIATDSTKLGEIPDRGRHRCRHHRPRDVGSSSEESGYHDIKPVFPLRRYESPVVERRFWGLFRRS